MESLFGSDLDGTLLPDDATLSDHSRRELLSLLEEGVKITVASARSVPSMKALLGGIPCRLPVIGSNQEDSVVRWIRARVDGGGGTGGGRGSTRDGCDDTGGIRD